MTGRDLYEAVLIERGCQDNAPDFTALSPESQGDYTARARNSDAMGLGVSGCAEIVAVSPPEGTP